MLDNCWIASQVPVEPIKAGEDKTSSRENWPGRGGGGGGGYYAGFKGMRMSELGQKSKPGERGEAYFSLSFLQWNLDITKLYITKSSV